MPDLNGTKTHENLKEAFAGESQANRRYLYFAQKADGEGYNDVAAVFRSTAEGETGHAHGHVEFLEEVGDPATGEPIGDTSLNLKAAIAGEIGAVSARAGSVAARPSAIRARLDIWVAARITCELPRSGFAGRANIALSPQAGSAAGGDEMWRWQAQCRLHG